MSEKTYQSKLIKEYQSQGWYVIKIIKASPNGLPDLLMLKKGVDPLFIEVKGEKGRLSELQKYRINELNSLGFNAKVSYEKSN